MLTSIQKEKWALDKLLFGQNAYLLWMVLINQNSEEASWENCADAEMFEHLPFIGLECRRVTSGMFCLYSEVHNGFWSMTKGWTDSWAAEIFDKIKEIHLPIPDDNEVLKLNIEEVIFLLS